MLFRAVPAVAGAISVTLGVVTVPWFLLPGDSGGVLATSLATGNWALWGAIIGGAAAVAAAVLRRRRIALVTLAAGLSVAGLLCATGLFLEALLGHPLTGAPELGGGFWFTLAGALFLSVGAMLQLNAVSARAGALRTSLLWNGSVIRQVLHAEPRTVEVGADPHDGLLIPTSALPPRHPLFVAHPVSGTYDLALVPGLEGTLSLGGRRLTPEEARLEGRPLRLAGDDWGKLDFGDISLVFQLVQGGRVAAPGRLSWDTWVGAAAVAAVVVLVGFATVLCWRWDPTYDQYRLASQKKRNVEVNAEALLAAKTPEEEEKDEPEPEELEESTSKAAPDDEGKFGDPDEAITKESKVPKNEAPMVTKVKARDVGLVTLLQSQKLQNIGAISNLLASNTSALTSKIAISMAGADGTFVAGYGTDGMGFRGTGNGGGGDGPFGQLHGLGKIPGPGGDGTQTTVSLGPKTIRKAAKLTGGTGQATGGCDKGNIASVVRARANAIRGCYEQRLQVNAGLQGKVTARWTISVAGSVTSASMASNTISDPAVGECVLRVIRRMAFQKPEGGICVVQWPFVFNPG